MKPLRGLQVVWMWFGAFPGCAPPNSDAKQGVPSGEPGVSGDCWGSQKAVRDRLALQGGFP